MLGGQHATWGKRSKISARENEARFSAWKNEARFSAWKNEASKLMVRL